LKQDEAGQIHGKKHERADRYLGGGIAAERRRQNAHLANRVRSIVEI
jgi:hypothetical protein